MVSPVGHAAELSPLPNSVFGRILIETRKRHAHLWLFAGSHAACEGPRLFLGMEQAGGKTNAIMGFGGDSIVDHLNPIATVVGTSGSAFDADVAEESCDGNILDAVVLEDVVQSRVGETTQGVLAQPDG